MPRKTWIKILIVSIWMVIPCFWHKWLVAGDLGSHTYNFWLFQLVKSGQAPGLWVAAQHTNVLFDWILELLAILFPIHFAARVAAAVAVLTFFWGSFCFISVAHGGPTWANAPFLAMVTYGWTFQIGFFNYYLSLGLAFFGIAFFWSQKSWWRLLPLILSPLIIVAHPFGFAWMLGAIALIVVNELWPRRPYVSVLMGVAMLVFANAYLRRHFSIGGAPRSAFLWNGLDQMCLAKWYLIPVAALALFVAFAIFSLARKLVERGPFADGAAKPRMLLQMYIIVQASILFLPDSIYTQQISAPLRAISTRTTSISAVLLCGLCAWMPRKKWQLPAVLAVATVFFALLYHDTGVLSEMQQQMQQLVRTFPKRERVLFTPRQPRSYRFSAAHIVDDACIEYCFSYGNYEPASNAFRVRVRPESRIVMSRVEQLAAMESGQFTVQPEDLPAELVYQCETVWTQLCIRSLQPGDKNESPGLHPK